MIGLTHNYFHLLFFYFNSFLLIPDLNQFYRTMLNFLLKLLFGIGGNHNKINFQRLLEEGGIHTVNSVLSEWITMVKYQISFLLKYIIHNY